MKVQLVFIVFRECASIFVVVIEATMGDVDNISTDVPDEDTEAQNKR